MSKSSDTLRAALEDARRQLAKAVQEQSNWSFEVNRLQALVRTIAANVCAAERNECIQREMQYQLSMTSAVEALVNGSAELLSPADVLDGLRSYGYDVDRYANPSALVHQTLKRLAEGHRIKEIRGKFARNDFNQWLFG